MSRKFDLWKWKNGEISKWYPAEQGVVRVRTSQETTLLLEAVHPETGEARTVVASVGTEHNIETAQPVVWTVQGPEGVLVSFYAPEPVAREAYGEVYTNIDRKPHESGTVMEVRKAVRAEQLRLATQLADVKTATRELQRLQVAKMAALQEPAPVEPAPVEPAPVEPVE